MTLSMRNKLTSMTYDIFYHMNDSKNRTRPENLQYLFGNLYISPHTHYVLLLSKITYGNMSKKYTTIITVPGARKPYFGNSYSLLSYLHV
jgi:hypothetical protein